MSDFMNTGSSFEVIYHMANSKLMVKALLN